MERDPNIQEEQVNEEALQEELDALEERIRTNVKAGAMDNTERCVIIGCVVW